MLLTYYHGSYRDCRNYLGSEVQIGRTHTIDIWHPVPMKIHGVFDLRYHPRDEDFYVSDEILYERMKIMPVKVGLKYIDLWQESMEDEILAYEQEEQPQEQIVFYGPSNFTRWSKKFGVKPMRDCLLGASGEQCVVNRGFGSSTAEHQLYYYPRMVRPLAPKVLVYTSYGNNMAFGYTDEEGWELAQRVISWAKTDFPGIRIYIVGAHPARDDDIEKCARKHAYNEMVKAFADSNEDIFFLNPFDCPELLRKDIFVEDGVHLNPLGYECYAAFYRDSLKDELAKF